MTTKLNINSEITIHPLTPERWPDFETLFGLRGACGGCWCMWYRMKRADYEKQKGEGNRQSMKNLVASGEIPGILAYNKNQAIAWCSIGPREKFPVLNRSRILKPVDDKHVWSVVCFFVRKDIRKQEITYKLLLAAIEFARENGAKIVEGYPIHTDKDNYPPVFAATGFYSTYKKAGFRECIRRSETRPIVRYMIELS